MTRPPHYPWLMAVDPRGAVIFGGIGSHGLTRLRLRRPNDPVIAADQGPDDWRNIWNLGARGPYHYTMSQRGTVVPTNPLALWFGWYAHNYIGMPDAWAVNEKTTDAQIDALFQWPPAIKNDSTALKAVRDFVRANRGVLPRRRNRRS